jgi:hypothetical protein
MKGHALLGARGRKWVLDGTAPNMALFGIFCACRRHQRCHCRERRIRYIAACWAALGQAAACLYLLCGVSDVKNNGGSRNYVLSTQVVLGGLIRGVSECADRLHQVDIALRGHLGDRQAIAAVASGDLGDQAQMAGDELVRRLAVAVLAPAVLAQNSIGAIEGRDP